jgi:hypothetical protein
MQRAIAVKKLKELLDSWAILAPEEIIVNGDCYELKKTHNWEVYAETEEIYLCFSDEANFQDTLQGYIQRCLKERGWVFSIRNAKFYIHAEVQISASAFFCSSGPADGTLEQYLLISYLKALAFDRGIDAKIS